MQCRVDACCKVVMEGQMSLLSFSGLLSKLQLWRTPTLGCLLNVRLY